MQRGDEYGGGVYSAPPIPPDHSGLYGGSPGYGSAPPSAPSAPAYSPAAPSYYQPAAQSSNISVSAYNSHLNSSFSQQIPVPAPSSYPSSSVYQNPASPLADHASSPTSYNNNLYPPASYAPVVPSCPPVGSPYDRSFDSPPATASVDSTLSQFSRLGLAPQTSGGYDSYGQAKIGYSSQVEQQRRYAGGGIYDQGTGGYDKTDSYGVSELGNYGNRDGADRGYDSGGFLDVYAYDGGGVEPYGARGTGTVGNSSWDGPAGTTGGGYNSSSGSLGSSRTKITRATPKIDGDAELGGVQKFRVKMLPETRSSDAVKDVVCQIGLDGVRMVDPSTSRTLRIYPLDTITKWEVKEPSVFTFWAKSAVDVEQRMIQLKSSSYTTTAILDTLTAACVQVYEMVGKDGPSDGSSSTVGGGTTTDTSAAKKASVLDWVAIRPRAPTMEEKQHWVPDEAVTKCTSCDSDFGPFLRRHHCRNCGDIFCDKCTRGRISLNTDEDSQPVRVCDRCLAEVTHRLENMTKANSKVSAPQRTHEDLAKKLQEELERNQAGRKPVLTTSSSGNASSRQTSVLTCSKCGAISLISGNNSRCSNCGADPASVSSRTEKTTSSYGASAGPRGPPHLWSSNAAVPDGPSPQMREVACPTCTVHLQVQVPSFGTETVECGVCQHPFLVSA
ncbi:unnamed protein product [Calypogeia fissa]